MNNAQRAWAGYLARVPDHELLVYRARWLRAITWYADRGSDYGVDTTTDALIALYHVAKERGEEVYASFLKSLYG